MDLSVILTIIGLVIAVAIGAWQIVLARKQLQPNKLGVTISPPFPQFEYKLSPTPEEIMASIEKVPPFQQNDARKSYIGIGIQWHLTFSGIQMSELLPTESPTFRLYLRDRTDGVAVNSTIDITQYPELKIMHPGRKIWIAGKIEKVDILWIVLSDVKLSIDNEK